MDWHAVVTVNKSKKDGTEVVLSVVQDPPQAGVRNSTKTKRKLVLKMRINSKRGKVLENMYLQMGRKYGAESSG